MNTKHYYIVPKDVAIAGSRHVAESHWIDLDATHVLLSVHHRSDHDRLALEQNVTAEPLPDVLDSSPISDEHVDKLAGLGIRRGHRTKDVVEAAKKIHRQM